MFQVYPKSFPNGKDMFDQMYYLAGPFRTEGWEERTERGVKLVATMSESAQSKLYISIDTSGYDPAGSVELHHGCSYHAVRTHTFHDGKWQLFQI